jgi:maleylpyruvate isomerase
MSSQTQSVRPVNKLDSEPVPESTKDLILYNYFRSSAAYRTRIALNIKGLDYRYVPVHLTKEGGQQFKVEYKKMNPLKLVPLLDDHGFQVSQSMAIIEYLDEKYPEPALMPLTPEGRARVRQLSLTICCDIHPLQNLRVLKYLVDTLKLSEEQKMQWLKNWLTIGLQALETDLSKNPTSEMYCFGDTVSMADCMLIPQMFSAVRFEIDTNQFPTLKIITENCEKLPAFAKAHPTQQIDFE